MLILDSGQGEGEWMAVQRVDLHSRLMDCLFVACGVVLFCAGYQADDALSDYRLLVTPIVLSAFWGVFYPFRFHARLLWILCIPFLVAALPWLGSELRAALGSPEGRSARPEASSPETLVLYCMALVAWASIYLAGWRLCFDGNTIRTSSLKDLFALSSVFCVFMVICRDAFDVSQYAEIARYSPGDVWQELVLQLVVWPHFAVILFGFQMRRPVAMAICVGISALFLLAIEYYTDTSMLLRNTAATLAVVGWCRLCTSRLRWSWPIGVRKESTLITTEI